MNVWPKGYQSAFVIGVDDVHPESATDGSDCGGDIEGGVLELVLSLLEKHPQVTITLFITPDWMFKPSHCVAKTIQRVRRRVIFLSQLVKLMDKISAKLFLRKWHDGRFRIDKDKYRTWCEFLKHYSCDGKFSLAIHGLDHFQKRIPPSQEFKYLSYAECIQRLRRAKEILDASKLPYTAGFAPPGWGVTEDLIKALVDESFSYIAGCFDAERPVAPGVLSTKSGIRRVPLYFPSLLKGGLINIPKNWSLEFSSIKRAERIVDIGGLLSIHAHITSLYHGIRVRDGITPSSIKKIENVLSFLEENYGDSIWYTSHNDVALYWKDKQI